MKRLINFSDEWWATIANGLVMVGVPNGVALRADVTVTMQSPSTPDIETRTVIFTPQTLLQLTPLHQLAQSGKLTNETFVFEAQHATEPPVYLKFEADDLEALFFIVDKRIAGADIPPMAGEVEVLTYGLASPVRSAPVHDGG